MLVRPHVQALVERVRLTPSVRAGFVCPYDRDALQLALSGAFAGFCDPVLIGAEARIRDAADAAGLDIARFPIANTPEAPREATHCAIELARAGEVAMLVKGDIGNEDLLGPIAAPESGLRSERRLSHACFLDLPGRPRGLLLTDAMLNVTPNLAAKRELLQNVVELAHALGTTMPRVALLAAVASVNPAFRSTVDAAALTSMAQQGHFPGAVVQGPVTADVALGGDAAGAPGTTLPAAAHADVLLAPDMESASLLLRAILALTGGFAAGVVLGARLPIVVPARTDTIEARMASCVLAALHATAVPRAAREKEAAAGTPVAAAADHATRVA